LRSDARRNRQALIAAAGELFRERGIDVPLEDVARAAGVSIGTLYNRFPARPDLIAAVFVEDLHAGIEAIEAAREIDDPWVAFVRLVTALVERQAADRGLSDVLSRGIQATAEVRELRGRGYEAMRQLIARAQAAGELRPDFTAEDLAFVSWGLGRTLEATAEIAPEVWRRHLALLLDGMRSGSPNVLPDPPLSFDQLQRAMRR
jgi:AcrR family transcriptional regulator